jgi:hypothetical protein
MRTRLALSRPQHGAVLILLVIALGVLAAAVFVGMLSSSDIQNQRDKTTAAALAEAKAAMVGFALANQDTPGGFSYPDRGADGNYDGHGDCVTSGFNNSQLLGKFPTSVEDGCTGSFGIPAFETDPRDAAGERVWYAVSQNLVKRTGANFPTINTTTLATPQNWLTVRDQNGNVLSNQVAFIVIAPSVALAGQSRSGAIPPAQNFLDNYTINGTTYKNWDSDLDFISAPPTNSTANQFNDRLLYVTASELANRLVDRVAGTVRSNLSSPFPNSLDTTSPTSTFPGWYTTNKWDDPAVSTYLKVNPNTATIKFFNCNSIFTFTWNISTTPAHTDMTRNPKQC